jgi:hypothetical protein
MVSDLLRRRQAVEDPGHIVPEARVHQSANSRFIKLRVTTKVWKNKSICFIFLGKNNKALDFCP